MPQLDIFGGEHINRNNRGHRGPPSPRLCKADGCTNFKRAVQGAVYCEDHTTKPTPKPASPVRHCQKCGKTWRRQQAGGSLPKYRLTLCSDCGRDYRKWAKAWALHRVDLAIQLDWLNDPRCWYCTQPVNLQVWGNAAGLPAVVDHDHACCPGLRSCGECVRGLAHNECNQRGGQFEALLAVVGLDRLPEIVRRLTTHPRDWCTLP